MTRTSLLIAMMLCCTRAAEAQPPAEDPVAEAPIRIGVIGLAPRFAVNNLGVDTNVFNEVTDPKSDFTVTGQPSVAMWMRTQRGLLSLTGQLDFVYFNKYTSERSINGVGNAQYEYRFNRLRPFIAFNALNSRERPGYEIDVRARRFEQTLRVGLDVRVASKSFVELSARRQRVDYAGDAVFQGAGGGLVALNEVLNRTLEAIDLTWRHRLTPLTTWVLRGSGERERFRLQPDRNGDSARVVTGFELGRFALIRGHALVGFRHLVGVEGGTLPDYVGPTADISVSYTSPTQTRISGDIARDVQYSFESITPYYIQTGWTATLTQRLTGRWDLQVLGGRDRLAYQSGVSVLDERKDLLNRVGGGIGYQIGDDTRVSFDVQSFQRESAQPGRSYKTLRAGGSVTYGF